MSALGRLVPVAGMALVLATSGCYRGAGAPADPVAVQRETSWVRVEVPLVRQRGKSDCGVAALASVLAYHGQPTPLAALEEQLGGAPSRGVRAGELAKVARERGLAAFAFFATVEDLQHELDRGRPVIVGIAKPYSGQHALTHYQVVIGYDPRHKRLLTLDPADGAREYPVDGFMREWQPTKRVAIVIMEPPRGATPQSDERALLSP